MSVTVRRGLAVAGVAAITFIAPSTAFAGHGGDHGKGHGKGHAKEHQKAKHHGKPASHHFTATGVFDAADGGGMTFTMDDKGGSKDLHGVAGVVITVTPTTKVTRDDEKSSLDALVAGDHVTVNGTRGPDGELDAAHVNAASRPTPEPTASEGDDETGDSGDTAEGTGDTADGTGDTGDSTGDTGVTPTPTPTDSPTA